MLVRGLFADKGLERNLGFWIPFALTVALALLGALISKGFYWGFVVVVPLLLIALWDMVQTSHSLRRNYPLSARFRWLFEDLRPFLRSYIVEGPLDGRPFDRVARSLVYARAKHQEDAHPFGTELDVYSEEYEALCHSINPNPKAPKRTRVTVGTEQCSKPYDAARLNISAMSFGALGNHAIEAPNMGAKIGDFYHDTGEGSISRYHREPGGDLVWEIGSGYFGCRNKDGTFNEERFARNATLDQVKMIEVKLSQGAKPGHGGILPGEKVTPEIAEARGVEAGKDVVSPASHSAFSTPREFLEFLEKLRELSGGKPVGFKLAIGHPWEWFAIVKAMLETGKTPDFIVVDGGEGGTGAAPLEFINRIGTPMTEALLLVHNTLVGTNLREHIAIGAAGKITSAFNIARTLALGADWCNAARGYMFSLGCIQALSCHTGKCPSGVATQDPRRSKKLDVQDKSQRVYNYHKNTLEALMNLLEASGLKHPSELGPEHIIRRTSKTETHSYMDLFPFLEPGALLEGETGERVFDTYWPNATPDSFDPPEFIRQLRETKLR